LSGSLGIEGESLRRSPDKSRRICDRVGDGLLLVESVAFCPSDRASTFGRFAAALFFSVAGSQQLIASRTIAERLAGPWR
jgi:hypothetical protein